MSLIFAISTIGRAQQGQTLFSLDSRFGYSTNSYLNPFLSEWDTSKESVYNFSSLLGQRFWYKNGHSFSMTGGLLYEPLFNDQLSNWKGGLGLIDYNYRISNNLSLGIDGGANYMSSSYSRTLFWATSKLSWFISPFTSVRFKAGSNFRSYRNYGGVEKSSDRFNVYSLELETWPSYRWQLSAGLHGTFDNLPDIQKGFNTQAAVGYYFKNGASLSLRGSMQQYQIEGTTTTDTGGGGSGPFPPVGGGGQTSTSTVVDTDRIFRIGLDGNLPLNERFTLFAGVEALQFNSESSNTATGDYRVSGGLRYSFEPNFTKGNRSVTPEWEQHNGRQEVRVQYSGQGRLYLVGDFNNWNKAGIALAEQTDNTYVARLSLEVGSYEYKLLKVQGGSEEWLPFSDEVYTVDDGFGSNNAILLVE